MGRNRRAQPRAAEVARALAVLAALSLAPPAFADDAATPAPEAPPAASAPPSEAAELLGAGRAALDAGKIAEACVKFDEAAAAGGGSEALLASGQCHELTGKSATAWRAYTEASIAAAREGAPEREDRARALAGKLAPRLSRLRIDVLSPAPGLAVTRNGAQVDPATYGALVPIDPGTYAIRAAAPGLDDFSVSVVVKGEADAQVVVIPALAPAGPKGPATPPPAEKRDGVVRTTSPLGVSAFVTTSFGLVGLATGTVFGVMALNQIEEAEEDPRLCPEKRCSPAGMAIVEEARTKGTVSTVAFAIGGTSLATGVALFLIREFTDVEKKEPPVTPVVGAGFVGIEGRF